MWGIHFEKLALFGVHHKVVIKYELVLISPPEEKLCAAL